MLENISFTSRLIELEACSHTSHATSLIGEVVQMTGFTSALRGTVSFDSTDKLAFIIIILQPILKEVRGILFRLKRRRSHNLHVPEFDGEPT